MTSLPAHAPNTDRPTVLAVDDDRIMRAVIDRVLGNAGFNVVAVEVEEAVMLLDAVEFDLVICDRSMPGVSGQEFLHMVRSDHRFDFTPFLFLTVSDEVDDLVVGLNAGADDYITKPFQPAELIARVTSRIERARKAIQRDHQLVDMPTFSFELERELLRARNGGPGGVLAVVNIPSLKAVENKLGDLQRRRVLEAIAAVIGQSAADLDIVGATRFGDLAILMPDTSIRGGADRLREMSSRAASMVTQAGSLNIRPVPMIGFVEFESSRVEARDDVLERAALAAGEAEGTQDLQPRRWLPPEDAAKADQSDHHPARESLQVMSTFMLGIILPFLIYLALDTWGYDVSWPVYIAVVIALVSTGALILMEGIYAGRHPGSPRVAGAPEPPASAIICAYMPNEAATIVETIEHFLRVDYAAGLQVILAYNTPEYLPVEAELQIMADQHPNLLLLKVENSNSKAQNLNAALARATGEFIGVFDADHQPDIDSFHRAWRWLSNGYDVVQGHCLVRNPEETFLAKMVAVEFETIYATAHPGRWLRDGFGVFGGSNGYWRTEALHMTRMRGSMLTEDIDASMRVLEAGGRIASDPWLISRELATTTVKQVWNQRLRWAQGWTQVSIRHLWQMMRLPHFNLRQRLGVFMLLFQREIYPWISFQIFPLLLFWWVRGDLINWVVPLFVAATIFTTSVGPSTVFMTYRLAHPSVKRKAWFWQYGVFSTLLYTEAKNVIARVAHLKEAMGESSWRVTPRSADPAGAALPSAVTGAIFETNDNPTEAETPLVPADQTTSSEPIDLLTYARRTTGSCLWCGETRSLNVEFCPRCEHGWIDQTIEEVQMGAVIQLAEQRALRSAPVAPDKDQRRLAALGVAVMIAIAILVTLDSPSPEAFAGPATTLDATAATVINPSTTTLSPPATTNAPTTAAPPSTTVPPLTVPPLTVPPVTSPPTTTTSLPPLEATEPVDLESLTLGAFALGPFDFGDDGGTVAGRLVATLGQPLGRYQADEAWGLCPAQTGRVLQWGDLSAIFRDNGTTEAFVGYRYEGANDTGMQTISGLSLGMTVGEAQDLYPSSSIEAGVDELGRPIFLLLRSSDRRTLLWGPVSDDPDPTIQGIYSYRPCDRGPFAR